MFTLTGLRVVGHREHEVLLAWSGVPRATYFVIQSKRADEPYAPLTYWEDILANEGEPWRYTGTTAAIAGLETGVEYLFRMKAYNFHIATFDNLGVPTYLGYTGPSEEVYATPLARLPPVQALKVVDTLNPKP